jgi:hypothetical protein
MTAQEQFPDRPCVVAYLPWEEKSGLWYFELPFRFFSSYGNGVIHAGFETDFGSIPAFLRGIVDDDDPKALCPFLRHDVRYAEGLGDRKDWDDELRDGMIACGSSRLKAALVHRAVRLFGGSHFKPKTL